MTAGGVLVRESDFIGVDSSPQNLVAEATDDSIRLTWTPSPDPAFDPQRVDRYVGQLDSADYTAFPVSTTTSSYEDRGVVSNTTYVYRITASRPAPGGLTHPLRSNPVTVPFRLEPTPTITPIPPTPRPTRPPTVEPTPADTPTVEPTPADTPTVEPTPADTPTVEPTPVPTQVAGPLQPPTITGISRSGRTLTATYQKASDNHQILFYLYRTTSNGPVSQTYDASSPVRFRATRGHFYYVRGKACDTGIRSNATCGELSAPSDTIYVPGVSQSSTNTPTRTPTPTPSEEPEATPAPRPTYPPTRTPTLCPENTPIGDPHCIRTG